MNQHLNEEFSNEFDVLYNNITSNQAPGLDEYEKSIFLTRAQDEIVKAYFNPVLNKTQQGFDGSEKRQIDFSMITKSKVYEEVVYTIEFGEGGGDTRWGIPLDHLPIKFKDPFGMTNSPWHAVDYDSGDTIITLLYNPARVKNPAEEFAATLDLEKNIFTIEGNLLKVYRTDPFDAPIFDLRDNTRSITIDDDILMIINEYVEVVREGSTARLVVQALTYQEYSRIMARPYKRPTKSQAWRLIDNSNNSKKSELIVGPNDVLEKYIVRYIKRPRAIRLTDFGKDSGITIDGGYTEQTCELDPILYPDIIQRGAELAYAVYRGTLNDQLSLATQSQTGIGIISTGNNNRNNNDYR